MLDLQIFHFFWDFEKWRGKNLGWCQLPPFPARIFLPPGTFCCPWLLFPIASSSPELPSPGTSGNFWGPRAQLGAGAGAVPPPGAAAAWNQSLTLFCERQITDFGGIIRPTRWEMEKQDNFPANFPACLPPRASLPMSWGKSAPWPLWAWRSPVAAPQGRNLQERGWGEQGWSRAWFGQDGRTELHSAPRPQGEPQGPIFTPGEPSGARSKVGLGFGAEGSKVEVDAVVPFLVQDQLWKKPGACSSAPKHWRSCAEPLRAAGKVGSASERG